MFPFCLSIRFLAMCYSSSFHKYHNPISVLLGNYEFFEFWFFEQAGRVSISAQVIRKALSLAKNEPQMTEIVPGKC